LSTSLGKKGEKRKKKGVLSMGYSYGQKRGQRRSGRGGLGERTRVFMERRSETLERGDCPWQVCQSLLLVGWQETKEPD